jgi:hypothetical protein
LRFLRCAGAITTLLMLCGCWDKAPPPAGEPMSADDFRRELVDVPLCGTPPTGPVAGKAMCTIHFTDGTFTLAGAGVVARGLWEVEGNTICRRDIQEPADQRRCVSYERLTNGQYRNSDGVDFCLGPCPQR